MKTIKLILALIVTALVIGCEKDELILPESGMTVDWRADLPHVTGDVEIMWRGGGSGGGGSTGHMEGEMSDKRAFVDLEAFPATTKKAAKGHFTLRIMDGEILERQIDANVIGAVVDPEQAKAWFLAEVYFDTKSCDTHGGGPGEGGHDDGGCSDDDGHDGGCSGDDGHDDGGCSGDDGHDDGGCSGDDGHDDGGCSGDDGHDDGGCSGDDGHDGGTGGQGGGSLNGQRCRVGQIVAVKVHDGGTPGREGDGITWKWYRANAHNLPDINDVQHWPHLCRKEILEGNLVVH